MTVSIQSAADSSASSSAVQGELSEEAKCELKGRLKGWMSTTLKKDQMWYLVDSRWLRQLQVFLGLAEPTKGQTTPSGYPGPLDNSGLMEQDGSDIKVRWRSLLRSFCTFYAISHLYSNDRI